MKKMFKKLFNLNRNNVDEGLVAEFINTQKDVEKLPAFSDVEKVKFEQEIAIDHLYNSSKIEGTKLGKTRLSQAINATK